MASHKKSAKSYIYIVWLLSWKMSQDKTKSQNTNTYFLSSHIINMVQLRLLSASIFLGTVLADISIQTFEQMGCMGGVVSNVHPNAAAAHDASGCQALGGFQSVGVISADEGFQCNIYSDSACANFIGSFDSQFVGACTNIIGSGVSCFSQALFDNPFADSTASVTIGRNVVTIDSDGRTIVNGGTSQACGDTGCDPTNLYSTPFSHFNKDCEQTVKMAGFYNNPNERDYMASLLGTALAKGMTNERTDPTGSTEGNDRIRDLPSFAQVIISDNSRGLNQAMMSATIDVQCNPPTEGNCDGLVSEITSDLLGLVPSVGDVIALGFKIGCEAISAGSKH
ncbi:hypothetical protein TWF694_010761 [Orbilia ellipsospora]|uniref:Uncharacterized protein n=1 Tax=Orbilia ellipsospora TaxID=2528407 RepID=A0AAV9X8C8_9PEZI